MSLLLGISFSYAWHSSRNNRQHGQTGAKKSHCTTLNPDDLAYGIFKISIEMNPGSEGRVRLPRPLKFVYEQPTDVNG